jgi:hypothetical protein
MKKTVLILTLMISVTGAVGQDILHIKGVKNVNVGAGFIMDGYLINAGFEYYLGTKLFLNSFLEYENTQKLYTENKLYGLSADLNYTVLTIKENMFFNLSLGSGGSYGMYKSRVEDLEKNEFIYNLTGGASYEYFVFNRISFYLKYNQIIFTTSSLGPNSRFTAGVKYYFY